MGAVWTAAKAPSKLLCVGAVREVAFVSEVGSDGDDEDEDGMNSDDDNDVSLSFNVTSLSTGCLTGGKLLD